MAFRWWTDDGPLLVLFGSFSSPHYFKKNGKNKDLDPFDKMFLSRACMLDPPCINVSIVMSSLEVIKLLPFSTQLSTKFILLINVKMPTIVGISTFISMINTTSERPKARNFFICRYFSVY